MDLRAHLDGTPPVAIVYTDLDGTLLGAGGSLLRDADGQPDATAALALVELAEADIPVVCVSGRRRVQLEADARLLGADGFIAEAGTVRRRGAAVEHVWGDAPRDLATTPFEALEVSGALAAVLDAFDGDLRPYEPWCADREGSALLHGVVDTDEADDVLRAAGCSWARLIDNGATGGWPGRDVRAYHLLARGVGKAEGVRADLADRGIDPAAALAVGDSAEDATMAGAVGTYVQVAGGHGAPGVNRFTADAAAGAGVAEAIRALLEARAQHTAAS